MVKIYKVKYFNTRTKVYETRYRVGSPTRKFSPLYYTRATAVKMRKKFG